MKTSKVIIRWWWIISFMTITFLVSLPVSFLRLYSGLGGFWTSFWVYWYIFSQFSLAVSILRYGNLPGNYWWTREVGARNAYPDDYRPSIKLMAFMWVSVLVMWIDIGLIFLAGAEIFTAFFLATASITLVIIIYTYRWFRKYIYHKRRQYW